MKAKFGQNSFAYRGAKIWNSLTVEKLVPHHLFFSLSFVLLFSLFIIELSFTLYMYFFFLRKGPWKTSLQNGNPPKTCKNKMSVWKPGLRELSNVMQYSEAFVELLLNPHKYTVKAGFHTILKSLKTTEIVCESSKDQLKNLKMCNI